MPFSKCSSHPSIVSTEATSLCMPYRADQRAESKSTGAFKALCSQVKDPTSAWSATGASGTSLYCISGEFLESQLQSRESPDAITMAHLFWEGGAPHHAFLQAVPVKCVDFHLLPASDIHARGPLQLLNSRQVSQVERWIVLIWWFSCKGKAIL